MSFDIDILFKIAGIGIAIALLLILTNFESLILFLPNLLK